MSSVDSRRAVERRLARGRQAGVEKKRYLNVSSGYGLHVWYPRKALLLNSSSFGVINTGVDINGRNMYTLVASSMCKNEHFFFTDAYR